MEKFQNFINEFRNTVDLTLGQYIWALLFIILGIIGRKVTINILEKLTKHTESSKFRYNHIFLKTMEKPLSWAFPLIFFYIALLILDLPTEPINLLAFTQNLFKGLSILLGLWIAIRVFDTLCDLWADFAEKTESPLDNQIILMIRRGGRWFLLIVVGVLFLHNMGYSVESLIAGLGLGGAAIALASQNTLANIFGSVVIFFDRPFHIGDWIEMGDIEGYIEDIGLRTTHIRTFANSLISIPNSHFTTNPVNNWSRMNKRRIKMTIGLTYDSTAEQIEKVVKGIENIILEDDRIHHDFYLVYFNGFGSSSLNIFIYCFTISIVWKEHMDIQQDLLLNIMREVEKHELKFAFPTQSLHVESFPENPPSIGNVPPLLPIEKNSK